MTETNQDGAWREPLDRVAQLVLGLENEVRTRGERDAFSRLRAAVQTLDRFHDGSFEHPLHRGFRERLGAATRESEFVRHCVDKQRGYAGDFEAMEMIWHGQTRPESKRYRGSTARGRLLNAYTMDSANCRANLSRVLRLRDLLLAHDGRRVASVGCGSMIELREAIGVRPDLKLEVLLFDQEAEALELARSAVVSSTVQLTALRGNVLRNVLTALRERAEIDLVYSSGLFDYFDVARSQKLAARMWRGVAKGGRLVIANEQPGNPTRAWMLLSTEWVLQSKNADQLRSIADGLPDVDKVTVVSDEQGVYQYLDVRRRS
ncbi:class I SAM-dependent methyltransferase [Haliangium ochraceum]|nr:class I SAM-dependent methyltransferase [Haliangium ochraceum]